MRVIFRIVQKPKDHTLSTSPAHTGKPGEMLDQFFYESWVRHCIYPLEIATSLRSSQ